MNKKLFIVSCKASSTKAHQHLNGAFTLLFTWRYGERIDERQGLAWVK